MDPWDDDDDVAEAQGRVQSVSAVLTVVMVVILIPAEVLGAGIWAALRYRPAASSGYAGDGFETTQFMRLMTHAFGLFLGLDLLVIGLAAVGFIRGINRRGSHGGLP